MKVRWVSHLYPLSTNLVSAVSVREQLRNMKDDIDPDPGVWRSICASLALDCQNMRFL